MIYLKRILFLFIMTMLMASAALADVSKQQQFLLSLESGSKNIHSISSNFTQKSYISLFADTMESKGKFTFSKPDNLRWEYSSPFVSGFLLKGSTGLKWDEAAAEPTPFSTQTSPEMAVISQQILAWTTMNMTWLSSTYSIKMINYSPPVMELSPKSKTAKSFLSLIKIFFSPDSRYLQGIELHEPDGDYTKIKFSDVIINGNIATEIFEKR
ncbi:LolA family protein [Maridesulfovibrio zosterae]|uniref:LolA family protein n=1 Tax=Maridesulfovibrio zosterae TaxID=82171 RepID=UPI0004014B0B|nr:outer membrane lipoprotein carrier protein LolA [Maridesulfovibrio zosterae]